MGRHLAQKEKAFLRLSWMTGCFKLCFSAFWKSLQQGGLKQYRVKDGNSSEQTVVNRGKIEYTFFRTGWFLRLAMDRKEVKTYENSF